MPLTPSQTSLGEKERFVGIMYARLPEGKWAGVVTHGLNELFADPDDASAMTFTTWLRTGAGPMYVVDGSENVHSLFKVTKSVTLTPGAKAVRDTWVCFSGVGDKCNPCGQR